VRGSRRSAIVWDAVSGDKLWEDPLDMGAAVHRNWCHQRAGENVSAFGLRVGKDDLLKMAKAIGVGAKKAALTLEAASRRIKNSPRRTRKPS
jgi:hypothetical protein